MPLHPTTGDIALRLILTVIAGAVIGFNRSARGHAAGLRTTILVGLAASVSMIQMNLLLPVGGKAPDFFSVMDVMRLPLGILTGVGFIGGGAILKKGNLVLGVTTAATMWMMTVIGLCLGGGQLGLGVGGTVLAVATLWALRWIDERIPRDRHAVVVIQSEAGPAAAAQLAELVRPRGYWVRFERLQVSDDRTATRVEVKVCWRAPHSAGHPDDLLPLLNEHLAVVSFAFAEESEH